MQTDSKEFFEFKRQLRFLKSARGEGTELISVLIPPGSNVSDVANRLREEASQAMNIKSKQTRKNVQAALERIMQMIKGVPKPPENGVAIYCGNVEGKIELYSVVPPEAVPVSIYRCDSTFFTKPLEEMIEHKDTYGLFVIDRREAMVATLHGKQVTIMRHLTSGVPGKHHKGGQSANRFQRLIEIAAHEFFKRVADSCNEVFMDKKIKAVIGGGSGPTKYDFVKEDYLHTEVKNKIKGMIDTGYTDETGIKELVDHASEVIEKMEVSREKDLVNKFIREVSSGGLATYGEENVRKALEARQADTLLLSEELALTKLVLSCPKCGKVVERIVKEADTDYRCQCGGKQAIESETGVLEDLSNLAESSGAKVEIISSDTNEGRQFLQGFGGIGALLRYR